MVHTPKTKKALEDLKNCTIFPVKIITTDEFADEFEAEIIREYSGVYHFYDNHHIIGINEHRPSEMESSFVHECIHAIMDLEGYPSARTNQDTINPVHAKVTFEFGGQLVSAIQHPEVYRRMDELYEIDMDKYFNHVINGRIRLFEERRNKPKNEISLVGWTQQDIITGFEYEFFTDSSKSTMDKVLKIHSPNAYDYLIGLRKRKLKFDSPENSLKSGLEILERVKKYGEKKVGSILSESIFNHIIIEPSNIN